MLFNSIVYLVFLPVVVALYWLSGHRLQNKFLLAASYLFYGLWDVRFLFTQRRSVSAVQPILPEMDWIVAHWESCSC